MIRSIKIEGLRGIRQGELTDFTPLVILVGPNGSGKSTILEALLLAASAVPGEALVRVVQRHHGVKRGARWLFWKGGELEPARLLVGTEDRSVSRDCELTRDRAAPADRTAIKFVAGTVHVLTASFPNDTPMEPQVALHISLPAKAYRGMPDVRLVDVGTGDLQPPLHQLYSAAVEQGRRDTARDMVAALLPGFQNLEILTEGDSPILQVVYEDRSVPAVLSGDGIQALLRLTLELAARPGGLVLVEEPEVHAHPGAMVQGARAIWAAVRHGLQVVLTTHSLELIDSLLSEASARGPEDIDRLSVYSMLLKGGELVSVRHSGREVEFARGQIQEDLR